VIASFIACLLFTAVGIVAVLHDERPIMVCSIVMLTLFLWALL